MGNSVGLWCRIGGTTLDFFTSADGGTTWSHSTVSPPIGTQNPCNSASYITSDFVSPVVSQLPATPTVDALFYTQRQEITGSWCNVLWAVLFTPATVIANNGAMTAGTGTTAPQAINVGALTSASADYGYPNAYENYQGGASSGQLLVGWYGRPWPPQNNPTEWLITAGYTTPTYTLTILGAGTGTGTVTDNTTQINCTVTAGAPTGSCSGSYGSGASVTLIGTPVSGSTLGSFSPSSPVTMSGNMNDTATFSLIVPSGVISGNGGMYGYGVAH